MLRAHLLHDVEPGKRPDPVVIPSFEPGELQIGPVLRILLNEVLVIRTRERTEPASVGPKHRDRPVIGRVEPVVGHTEKPGLHGPYIGIDTVEEVAGDVPSITGDAERLIGHGSQFNPLPLREGRRHPARHRVCRVNGFAADRFRQALAELTDSDRLLRDLRRVAGKPDDVARLRGAVATQDEIGSRKHEEVEGMGVDELTDVEKFPEFLSGRGRFDAEDPVERLCGREVVRRGAYPADAGRDPGCFLDGRPDEELFKPPEFYNLKVGRIDLAPVVEEDPDPGMALYPGHRTDRNLLHLLLSLMRSRIFDVSLSSMTRLPMVKAYIVCATS